MSQKEQIILDFILGKIDEQSLRRQLNKAQSIKRINPKKFMLR